MTELIASLLLLFKLVIAHALCDFTLQTDVMATGKNRHYRPAHPVHWMYWMSAHALIQAGGVWVVTNSWIAAAGQFVSHWFFDFAKCDGHTDQHGDQLAHFVVLLLIAVSLHV